jgi:hypothetical protein
MSWWEEVAGDDELVLSTRKIYASEADRDGIVGRQARASEKIRAVR